MVLKFKNTSVVFIVTFFFLFYNTLRWIYQEPYAVRLKKYLDELFDLEIIFVGGYEGSGTSLMRSILDVHPNVKCGPEIKITIEALKSTQNLLKNGLIRQFVNGSGLNVDNVNKASGLFNLYLYLLNNPNANRICSKEPDNSEYILTFKNIFPKSKFIHMVRDGREASFSIIRRWGHKKFDFENFYKTVADWNRWNSKMHQQCIKAGSEYCKIVKYDELVLKPKKTIKEIASFLRLKWTNNFLRHQEFLKNEIKLSKYEPSLSGIKNEINNQSLANWVGKIENYDEKKMKDFEMLLVYNYL